MAQDFPGAESSARTSWSCPPDDATPPDESQIGEACREKAHGDEFCGLSLVVGEGKPVALSLAVEGKPQSTHSTQEASLVDNCINAVTPKASELVRKGLIRNVESADGDMEKIARRD